MKQTNSIRLPETMDGLLGFSTNCPCGRVHSVDTRRVVLREGALDELPDTIAAIGKGLELCVVQDRVTAQVAGERVSDLLRRDGHSVRTCMVPDGVGNRPHADEENLALVEGALAGADLAVAVGSGTINDLAKLASFNRGIPYVSVATAPSMNGYASAIAAIMRKGVKRTEECHQPFAVVADLHILGAAPMHLVAAGLGDLESKPVCTADFRLSGILRGTYHCPVPEQVVFAAEKRAAQAAGGLAQGDPESVEALSRALILSGFSMKMAGSSSPASGGEHLISHFWDMTAAEDGRVEGWHGAQVGVTTIVTATLYEMLSELDPGKLDIDGMLASRPGRDEILASIAQRHGPRAAEVEKEYLSKHLNYEAYREELSSLVSNWENIWSNLGEVLRPGASVRDVLEKAGAPVNVSGLGLRADDLRRAYLCAREIRGRYTVLDLAADLCMLEGEAEEVLARSGCLH